MLAYSTEEIADELELYIDGKRNMRASYRKCSSLSGYFNNTEAKQLLANKLGTNIEEVDKMIKEASNRNTARSIRLGKQFFNAI